MLDFLAACCVLLLILAQVGRFDDRIDAINFALPYLTLSGIVCAAAALFWAWHRKRRVAPRSAVLLLAILLPAPLLWSETQPAMTDADCGGAPLRIVEFNVWKDNPDVTSAVAWLRLAHPDIIVLEEAEKAPAITTRLGDLYPYRQDCLGGDRCSTVILSRTPPLASGGLAHGDPENRAALSAAWGRFGSASGPFTLVGVHLDRPWPFPHFAQDRAQLVDFARFHGSDSMIITGDFNLPGWTFQMRRFEQALGLPRRSRGLPTWPATLGHGPWRWPLLGIDHVFAGKAWQLVELSRGPMLRSDHYPLAMTFNRCPIR